MELENLKSAWLEMSRELEKQKKITEEIILKMMNENSKSRLGALISFEILGLIISAALVVCILANFSRLDNWLSITGGLGTLLILLAGVIMSGIFLEKAKKIDVVENGLKQTLVDVCALRRTQYISKWANASLGILLPFFLLPVLASLYFDKELLYDLAEFRESLIPSLLLIPVIWFFIQKFYSRKLDEVNRLLQDIEN